MLKYLLFSFFIVSSVQVFSREEGFELSKKNIHTSIEEMLAYHVEHKVFSSVLAKRSFKLFFDQFDPGKMYLLDSEVSPFWSMKEDLLQQVVTGHLHGEYFLYEKASSLIRSSILRAREYRKKIRDELIGNPDLTGAPFYQGVAFVKTEELLYQRIKNQMLAMLQLEKEQERIEILTTKNVQEILAFCERKWQRFEAPYLSSNKEHFLAMHTLKAFAKSLDAHSSFFTPEEAYELRASLEKQFEGIGVVLKESLGGVVVKTVVRGGPADKSGKLSSGDSLLSIDGNVVSESSYLDVMNWLKGDVGKGVNLTVRKKTGEVISFGLIRDKIAVEAELVRFGSVPFGDGHIGIIDIPSFYESADGRSCEKDVRDALRSLKSLGNLQGLILDMRANSGGFLSQAVKMAGLFVSSGVIVISKYAEGQMRYLRELDGKVFYDGPLVVLASKASASAAEIVAQALQDYGIAVVVGDERTYGKGTIQHQTVTDENASTYFKVTVGKYYTVSGRSTQIEGVKADIVVPTKYSSFNIGEKYLPYALKNDQVPDAFRDPLLDVDARSRAWLKKNYLPNLQKKFSFWTEVLPILKKNSEYRLSHDKNFLCFLQFLQNTESPVAKKWNPSLNFGVEDLQVLEGVGIVKDMILLRKYAKK